MPHTLVSFHAHPDDEALLTSGSIARAVAEGHRVVLVFATRGEVGDVDQAILGEDEGLADRRVREAHESAAILGVERVEFLGYADSGSASATASEDPAGASEDPAGASEDPAGASEDPAGASESPAGAGGGAAGRPTPFAHANVDEAAARLAAILTDEHADVVTTYDPFGGYGHPDHRQVHLVGQRAAELAGTPVVLEATFDRGLLRMAADLAPTLGLELPEGLAPQDMSAWFTATDEITHRIDVQPYLDQKRRSMAAHASQTTSSTGPFRNLAMFLALPDEWFALAFGTEWYVDRRAAAPDAEATGDLFADVGRSTTR